MKRSTSDESGTLERFRARYDKPATRAARAVERAAIGANVGCNGYTTVQQAEQMGRLLRLGPGKRLLDIGCGRGYPGVYLARTTGCTVTGSDLSLVSLGMACKRARRQRIDRRASVAAASALHLPFRAQSFDAVIHTDVLC